MQVKHAMSDESLLSELRDLKQLDWGSVWEGPPTVIDPGFEEWCAQRGWTPLTYERTLDVTTRSGNTATLSSNGHWSPVMSLDFFTSLVKAETEVPEEKEEIIQRGVDGWRRYTDLISRVWGTPTWSGAAGDSDFPEAPVDSSLWTPESSRGNPYRLSFWGPGTDPHGPVVVLDLGITLDTWSPDYGAAMNVSMSFSPPLRD
ncbi:hypothetical protein ABZ635_11785 [Nocardiopsis sp. NPDC007018]|uniref:hypothetical protein n=1 Tax=Nocardiopsis sp. NPDC007018 TaxID=3155721 RepID=UPI0033ED0BE7